MTTGPGALLRGPLASRRRSRHSPSPSPSPLVFSPPPLALHLRPAFLLLQPLLLRRPRRLRATAWLGDDQRATHELREPRLRLVAVLPLAAVVARHDTHVPLGIEARRQRREDALALEVAEH